MGQYKKFTISEIQFIEKHALNMPHYEIAKKLGRTTKSINQKCSYLGFIDKEKQWSNHEIALLINAYSGTPTNQQLKLQELSDKLGREKTNVSRKARTLGLTNNSRKMVDNPIGRKRKFETKEERSEYMSEITKDRLKKFGHPRGALGMKHTDETKEIISKKSIISNSLITDEQRVAINLKTIKTKVKNGTYAPERIKTSWKSGWREIGGVKKYYRSKWEANYAYYLQWLKEKGQISDWLHEPITFWFEGVKRGCVSYLPDFWVQEANGSEAFHEVKGWMDDRSKTKIRRMAKYHPEVKLVVIDSAGYTALKKSVQGIVPGWEL